MRNGIYRALAVLVCLGLAACGSDEDTTKAAPALREVSVVQVETRPLVGGITASGQLVAREEAVVAAEVSGYRIAQVLAEDGDYVRAGQPLVRMDTTLLNAQIAQSAANLAQQQAQAAQAQREAARVGGLDREGVLSTEQVEQRRTAAATAAASARAAAAQLDEQRTRLSLLTIRAPVSGRIVERTVRPGEIAAVGGTPMFRIVRDGLVELEANVPEAELATITPGQPVEVQLPDGRNVDGSVRLLSGRVADSRLGNVRVALPSGTNLRPGGFGRAIFGGAVMQAPAVPEKAVRYDANGVSVMTLDKDNRARRVAVKTGRRVGGWVELLSGPAPGTRVLLGGGAFVLEGEQVKPVATATSGQQTPAAGTPASARQGPAAGVEQAAKAAQGSAASGAGGAPAGQQAGQTGR